MCDHDVVDSDVCMDESTVLHSQIHKWNTEQNKIKSKVSGAMTNPYFPPEHTQYTKAWLDNKNVNCDEITVQYAKVNSLWKLLLYST